MQRVHCQRNAMYKASYAMKRIRKFALKHYANILAFLLVAKREAVVKLDGWTLQCYSDINHTLIGRLEKWRDKNRGF